MIRASGGDRFYAGIGSQETPPRVSLAMTGLAHLLWRVGYTLRSGGAEGADRGFEDGVPQHSARQIFIPWVGFLKDPRRERTATLVTRQTCPSYTELEALAESHHPGWHNCSDGVRKLHTRNSAQIMGFSANAPVDFVLCWTSNGKIKGGTGQAMRIAERMNIPVVNLHDEICYERLLAELRETLSAEN